MGSYIPSTKAQQQEMLSQLGLQDFKGLYQDVPASMYLEQGLNIPAGMSELEVRRAVSAMAKENRVFSTVLRGAGAYDHYIPSIVKYIPAKEEFLTAYTPYQAEMSQGILQSIFEYQTMICELTGMDVSNASVYDGATAAAEAAAMCRDRKRTVTLVSAAAHPDTINTIRTYCYGAGCEMRLVPLREGKTDLAALKDMLAADVASFYVQQPNFYGLFEDAQALGQAVHEAGAMYVMGCNPIALAITKTPAACGADVAVGEGQPLGMPLSYGGPYLGYMATTKKHMRKLPGRIVGETVDNRGGAGLRIDPPGPGTAHPPGKGQQQHLLQPGPVRPDCRGVYGRHGSRRHGGGRPAEHGQGPLSGGSPVPDPRGIPAVSGRVLP